MNASHIKAGTTGTGIISLSRKGFGFVTPFEADGTVSKKKVRRSERKDPRIEAEYLNCALHGDTVEYRTKLSHPTEPKAVVVRVLARASDRFVGTLANKDGELIFVPDDGRAYIRPIVVGKKPEEAKEGMKAFVLLKAWSDPKETPTVEIISLIGEKGVHETEMRSILISKGFILDYPADVEREAEEINVTAFPIPEDEIAKRLDMRGTLTFTIDPEDAKDFDDAISYKELGDGKYEIGVHIADVSHYVRPGMALDHEAINREFSVYLVDRTVPMLPHQLSTHVCSLNPHEDRLAFSAIFVLDDEGHVHERKFAKTVIHSDKRFSYEEAQAVLDQTNPDKELSEKFFPILTKINNIAKALYRKNKAAGAIDFDTTEVKFVLDENFKPIAVRVKPRLDTNRLIEEYMLLANREVAAYIHEKSKNGNGFTGLMYRVHDSPDADRIKDLALLIRALGHQLPIEGDGKVKGKDINAMLAKINGQAEEGLLKTATIRSMSKAIYSPSSTGHFGLAFTHYTHFTSPIRRYPDLIVHRILHKYLEGSKPSQEEAASFAHIAQRASQREVQAAEAERDSVRYKQCEYWQERLGQEINGVISGVTEWGIYVEDEETHAEGMVRLRDLGNDYFELKEKMYAVVGSRTGKKFSLGDKVRAKVMNVDVEQKTIDMALVDEKK